MIRTFRGLQRLGKAGESWEEEVVMGFDGGDLRRGGGGGGA